MDTKHVNFSISSARERSNGSRQLAPLQIGQQFTTRVLQTQAEGQLVIELNRQSYIANSNSPLAAGQEFPVQVMQTGEPIQLKILGDDQQSTVENLLLAELIQAKSELATASSKPEPGTLLTLLKQIADKDAAPRLVAKGQGEIAKRILELAGKSEIPVHHDPTLIEILSRMDLEEHIPPQCYRVVAELLAFTYRVEAMNSERKIYSKEGREL